MPPNPATIASTLPDSIAISLPIVRGTKSGNMWRIHTNIFMRNSLDENSPSTDSSCSR
jgi:hypothetical protein